MIDAYRSQISQQYQSSRVYIYETRKLALIFRLIASIHYYRSYTIVNDLFTQKRVGSWEMQLT